MDSEQVEAAEALRRKYGKVAIVGEAAGWFVQYMHGEETGSVGAPVRLEWRPLTGVAVDLAGALSQAGLAVPTAAAGAAGAPEPANQPVQTAEPPAAVEAGPDRSTPRPPVCPECGGKVFRGDRWGTVMAMCSNEKCQYYNYPVGHAGEFDWGQHQ